MKTVIVEDESLAAQGLRKLLLEAEPDIEVAAILPSLAEARKWFAAHPEPDLLFLDIQLSDGVSFDLFKTVHIECPVIFTTAYDDYAIRAFQLNSIDYLLKPIDKAELVRALEKYRRWAKQPGTQLREQLGGLLKDLSAGGQKKYKERFMVHSGKTLIPLTKDQISGFVKDELIFLMSREGERYLTDFDTLDGLDELIDPAVFFRANRQYIIHIDAVAQLKPHFTGKLTVVLKGFKNMEIDISREKAVAFKAWLNG